MGGVWEDPGVTRLCRGLDQWQGGTEPYHSSSPVITASSLYILVKVLSNVLPDNLEGCLWPDASVLRLSCLADRPT